MTLTTAVPSSLMWQAALDSPEPFQLEATFTHQVPAVDHPTRIWVDPAGRIIIEWESRIAVLFPQGYIPRRISLMMDGR